MMPPPGSLIVETAGSVNSKLDRCPGSYDAVLLPWRRFFVEVTDGRRSAHLHVMTINSPRWSQQIAFRDALRADPSPIVEYAAVKSALAGKRTADRETYTAAKADFIRSVLARST